MTTTALPRATARDRRTVAERAPQIPVTLYVHLIGETSAEKLHTAVGVGGWFEDYAHAAVRALDVPAEEITIVAARGGHH